MTTSEDSQVKQFSHPNEWLGLEDPNPGNLATGGTSASESDSTDLLRDFEIGGELSPRVALRLLNAAVLQSTESILITDANLDLPGPKIVFVNPAFSQMTGYEPNEIIGKTPSILYGPATDRNVLERLREELPREHVFDGEAVMYRKDGSEYIQRWHVTPIRGADGTITHYAAVQRDVTELRDKERRIARMNRARALIGSVSSTLLRAEDRVDLFREVCRVLVTQGTFAVAWLGEMDPGSQKLTTVAVNDLCENPDHSERPLDALLPAFDEIARHALRERSPAIVNDVANSLTLSESGRNLQDQGLLSAVAYPLFAFERLDSVLVLTATERNFFDEEEVTLLNWLAVELSSSIEHMENAHKLKRLTYFDALTGFANTTLFRDRLGQFIRAARESSRKVCVAVLDLEDFTQINNAFTRSGGDDLLLAVTERLRGAFTEPFALGRLGADTFAVASPGENELVASKLCEAICNVMAAPFSIGGQNLAVSAQTGIAIFPDDSEDEIKLFKHAELALKLCKSSGQRCVYYSAELNARVTQRIGLEAELRRAVANGEFILRYQPRLDMISGEIVGAEALIRWNHPERGLVEPGSFIALAEDMGLIVAIGAWVIDTICAQQAAWIAAGIPVVPIAANVSAVQLEKDDLVTTVRAALTKHSLEPSHLHLEITESVVMNDAVAAAEVLSGLRNLGISLALDDFGTGYSSLALLKRLPFNYVKIDRGFVADITHSAGDSAIALAVIAIAERMGLTVVAEGVETKSQFTYLLRNGCHEMQGHYFSPAVALDEFEGFLRTGKRLAQDAIGDETRRSVLVVDDEPGIRAALSRMLRRDGYRVITASSGSAGLELLALHTVQVIIADQRMPEMSGTQFLSVVKDLYPDTMRIILSGYSDLKVVTDSVNRGSVFRFLTKPWDDDVLREQVRDAFRRYLPREGVNSSRSDVTKRAESPRNQ